MIAKPRFSKVLLLRIVVWLTVSVLLILHFKLEIEMLGVVGGTGAMMFLLLYEVPLSARKHNNRDRHE